jgi:hypothetical protein
MAPTPLPENRHDRRCRRPYRFPVADVRENFPAPLLYIGWDQHLMFCAPFCLPLPPDMPFDALLTQVLPGIYGAHPDFARIDWDQAQWFKAGQPWRRTAPRPWPRTAWATRTRSASARRA